MAEVDATTSPSKFSGPTSYYPFSPTDPEFHITTPAQITPDTVSLVPPVNKFDTSRVDLLSEVSPEIWIPILPALLNWTLDQAWPSSHVIYPLLTSNPTTIKACIPLVTDILSATEQYRDEEHQSGLLYRFVQGIALEYQVQMLPCLKEFLSNITDQLEEDWGLRETATETIEDIEKRMEHDVG